MPQQDIVARAQRKPASTAAPVEGDDEGLRLGQRCVDAHNAVVQDVEGVALLRPRHVGYVEHDGWLMDPSGAAARSKPTSSLDFDLVKLCGQGYQ